MRGPALVGLLEFLQDNDVPLDADVTGVSIGSIVAALVTNGVTTTEMRAVFHSDLSEMGLGLVARALTPPLNPLKMLGQATRSPLKFARSLLLDPLKLTMALASQVKSLITEHQMKEAEELGDMANDLLRMLGGGLVDMVPVARMLVEKYELVPNKRLRIVAFDILSRRPVVFTGTGYDLALAIAASCSVPGMMRPVAMTVDGKLCLLIDGGIWHPHPGVFCNKKKAIIAKLIDVPGMGYLYQDRESDFPVSLVDQGATLFGRLDEDEVEELVQEAYRRAAEVLTTPIKRGQIKATAKTVG